MTQSLYQNKGFKFLSFLSLLSSSPSSPLISPVILSSVYSVSHFLFLSSPSFSSYPPPPFLPHPLHPLHTHTINHTEDISVTFADVKGVDEAKDELQDVVEFLRDPDRFSVLGGKMPHGVLLVGEPGVGKTLLAKAVAGEAGVPFFHAAGSEFDEIFVGTG